MGNGIEKGTEGEIGRMTSQKLAGHLHALISKAQHENLCSTKIETVECTPSIRIGVHYLGVTIPDTDQCFAVEITEL
jgi:hypothetical protein